MQRPVRLVVPDQPVVGLQRRSIDRLREIFALEHQRVVAGSSNLALDVERRGHAFRGRIAGTVGSRPYHLIALEFSEDRGIEDR